MILTTVVIVIVIVILMIIILLPSTEKAGRAIGILRIDYDYPVSPGDVDSPDSFTYPIISYIVKGLTFERAQSGYWDSELEATVVDGLRYLRSRGVCGITGDCGFMMYYQQRIAALSHVPVVLSSLMQLPIILSSLQPESMVLILTANDQTLTKEALAIMLTENNILSTERISGALERLVVVGCQEVVGFDAVANGSKVSYDVVVGGINELVRTKIQKHPGVRAILSECTELGMFSDDLRFEFKYPVFDSITCIDFMWTSSADNPRFGLSFNDEVVSL
jgi:hypothetical protein